MGDPRRHSGGLGTGRQWSFADCHFDESNWTLTVGGKRVAIEPKPLEILRQLLLRPGQVVSKAELLDSIWPEIAVVEASLPTAVHKLRAALGDESRDQPIIETAPRIGYRLAVPVETPERSGAAARAPAEEPPVAAAWTGRRRLAAAALVLAIFSGLVIGLTALQSPAPVKPRSPPTIKEVDWALRRLDIDRIDALIASGWDVNMAMDSARNTPLNRLLDMCEWDPAHDRRRILLMARTLIDAGTRLGDRNGFGDTPYSIAKAPRFCGADHPVTVMLRNLCYNGGGANTLGDRCLASYELKRGAGGA